VFRRRHHADLLQESDHIFFRPLLNQLTPSNAVNSDGGRLHVIASPGSARKITFMFAKRSEPRHDLIPFGDLVFNAVISGSCFPEKPERLLQAFPSGREGKRWRIVTSVDIDLSFFRTDSFASYADSGPLALASCRLLTILSRRG
jgi:hypothetical protein